MGTQFITELAKLYDGYGSASAMESVALKAAMVLPPLLLQKPHRQSKSREHTYQVPRTSFAPLARG